MITAAQRPDLIGPMWNMPNNWPEYMLHDPVAELFRAAFQRLSRVSVGGIGRAGDGCRQAEQPAVRWDGTDEELPDQVGRACRNAGSPAGTAGSADAVSLLEARMVPEYWAPG